MQIRLGWPSVATVDTSALSRVNSSLINWAKIVL